MQRANNDPTLVDARPTKALFVEMLTRDIPLDKAVTDLVDNSVDGARRLRDNGRLDGLKVELWLSAEEFRIKDNCGGIPIDIARNRAFRFGRKRGEQTQENSIGQFGVGMKRALFKFGRDFDVESYSATAYFKLSVNADTWEDEETPWDFHFNEFKENLNIAPDEQGTLIVVRRLLPDASSNFGREGFVNALARTIAQAQQTYLQRGLEIVCNDIPLLVRPWQLKRGHGIRPGYRHVEVRVPERAPVSIDIFVGVADSNPAEAGWYVSCNERIVLSADQGQKTGWNRTAETTTSPKYHNQFARFRGYVAFTSKDASQLPWNTTKDDIDVDAAIYRAALNEMVQMMRRPIDFLNALDREDPETGGPAPLTQALEAAPLAPLQDLRDEGMFAFPDPEPGPPMATISYKKPRDQVDAMKQAFGASLNREVGARSFEYAYEDLVE